MIEVALVVVLAFLSGLLAWEKYQNRKEKDKLINVIISKSAEQLRDLEVAEKTKIVAEAPREPDLIPMENVSDEEFKKIVDEELHG